ncbi:MAG: DUF1501 domain-containing protein [Pseudomonadota bacterium]
MRTRRNFLELAQLATTAAFLSTTAMPRFAFGQTSNGKVFIKVFMRGGADGLHLFPRVGDPFYYQYRPDIAIEGPGGGEGSALSLEDGPGGSANMVRAMNPNLINLLPIYEAGNMLVSPATSSSTLNQSHFDSQRWIGVGARNNIMDGYLNRFLQETTGMDHPIRSATVGKGDVSRELQGQYSSPTITRKSDFDIRNGDFCSGNDCAENRLLETMNSNALHPTDLNLVEGQLKESQLLMIETIAEVQMLQEYQPSAAAQAINPDGYSNTQTGRGLQMITQLLRGGVPLEVAALNWQGGSWDSHNNQININSTNPIVDQNHRFNQRMRQGADDLAVFVADMEDIGRMDDIMILVCTEFGRTVKQNGSVGTDHARGAAWLAIGNNVNGGMADDIATLDETTLERRNRIPTAVDYRDMVGEILVKHMGLPENMVSDILPGHNNFNDYGFIGSMA